MINFNNLINDYLYRKSRPKEIGRYYPSDAGKCLRKVWYSYKYPKELDTEVLKIFEMGNILHDFVVEVLQSEKTPSVELLKSEIPFKMKLDEILISGRVDNLILIRAEGKTYLVEVKSTKFLFDEPQKHNIMQLQLYMHALGVHNGILLYVEKSALKTKIFDIKFDKKIVDNVLDRFRRLHKDLIENTLPIAEAKTDDDIKWMCKYCEYSERCLEERL